MKITNENRSQNSQYAVQPETSIGRRLVPALESVAGHVDPELINDVVSGLPDSAE